MKLKLLGISLGFLFTMAVQATPISYTNLANGVPVTGQISATHTYNNPVGAQYYSLYAAAGTMVNVVGARLEGTYDMAFWVFRGLFMDTNDFGGEFSYTAPPFVTIGDDENAPNVPGPYGDPNTRFFAGTAGFYTIAVANFVSGDPGSDGLFDFRLVAFDIQNTPNVQAVPAPAVLALMGLGLVLLVFAHRRLSS